MLLFPRIAGRCLNSRIPFTTALLMPHVLSLLRCLKVWRECSTLYHTHIDSQQQPYQMQRGIFLILRIGEITATILSGTAPYIAAAIQLSIAAIRMIILILEKNLAILPNQVKTFWPESMSESQLIEAPGPPYPISEPRRPIEFKMDAYLMHLRELLPLWSNKQIATQMVDVYPSLSAEECKRRLDMLSVLPPERFGSVILQSPLNHAKLHYTSEGAAATDSMITKLRPALCNGCTALALGDAHVEVMMDINRDRFIEGPNVKGHPANQSLRSLKRSSGSCRCCEFMYNAASRALYHSKIGAIIRRPSEDLHTQTQLGFTRYSREQALEIRTRAGRSLALLRIAHC